MKPKATPAAFTSESEPESTPVGEGLTPRREEDLQQDHAAPAGGDSRSGPTPRRLVSLDAFRGLSILGMLLVNNIALDTATPKHLTHAPWNEGVRFADLVFPWFLLIVGVAIPYAVASHHRKGLPTWRYDLKVLSRTMSLILLGCLIDSSLARRPFFDMGVLQLIGLAYLVGALLCELPPVRRVVLAGAFLVAHWAAIRFLPVPGLGSGIFTENLNVILHLNQVYLAPLHLKGLISVVPTSALVLIGTVMGDLFRSQTFSAIKKVACLIAGGLGLLLIGWLWNLDLPFNKAVWTASYILFAAGWGSLVLGLFYLLIDVCGWRAWAFPLVVFGMNAILAYVLPILVKIHIMQEWRWKMADGSRFDLGTALMHFWFAHAGRYWGGWLYTLSYIFCWWLVLWQLHRKGIFLRV